MTEIKSNEATPQRPQGDRLLDSSMVSMDLNQFMTQVRNEPSWKDSDRNSITIFKSEGMRIVLMGLHKGTELKTHTANGIISVQVLEGKIEFSAKDIISTLQKGQMIALHERIPHSVFAVEESFFLLTLSMDTKKGPGLTM